MKNSSILKATFLMLFILNSRDKLVFAQSISSIRNQSLFDQIQKHNSVKIDTNQLYLINYEKKPIAIVVSTNQEKVFYVAKLDINYQIITSNLIYVSEVDSNVVIKKYEKSPDTQYIYTISKNTLLVVKKQQIIDSSVQLLYQSQKSIDEKFKQIPSLFKLCRSYLDNNAIKFDCTQNELFINLDLVIRLPQETPLNWYSRKESDKYIATYISMFYFTKRAIKDNSTFTENAIEVEYAVNSFY